MSRRLKRWGVALLICIVVVVAAGIVLLRWINGSSTGSVHVGSPDISHTPVLQPVAVKTAYFTTELPTGFSIKRQTETPGGAQTLLQLEANTHTDQDEQFAATVGNLPSDGLSGVGDYNLRTKDTTTYAPFSPVDLPAGTTAFRTTSGAPSFVIFWPHGAHYIELAFSTDGGVNLTQLQAVFTGVMAHWQWQ